MKSGDHRWLARHNRRAKQAIDSIARDTIGNTVWNAVGDTSVEAVRNTVGNAVIDTVRNAVGDAVRDSIRNAVGDTRKTPVALRAL